MSKNVQLVKLVNNELLVADVSQDGDNVVLDKPFQVALVPTEQGDQMAFIDFNSQLGKADVLRIKESQVLYQFEANDAVEASYIQRSSGIELAGAGAGGAPQLDISDLTS